MCIRDRHDAYISVVEALKHGGIAERATVDLHWIDSETLNDDNTKELLGDMAGIIVPGGFGSRGVEGMISAAKYARENNVPYLGLCLGMQVAIIEFARHVCGFHDAHLSLIHILQFSGKNHPAADPCRK